MSKQTNAHIQEIERSFGNININTNRINSNNMNINNSGMPLSSASPTAKVIGHGAAAALRIISNINEEECEGLPEIAR